MVPIFAAKIRISERNTKQIHLFLFPNVSIFGEAKDTEKTALDVPLLTKGLGVTQMIICAVSAICEDEKGELLKSLIYFYKPPLQNRFFSIKQSLGCKDALNFAFLQPIDIKQVTKTHII